VTDWWNRRGSPLYSISLVSGPNEGMCVTDWWNWTVGLSMICEVVGGGGGRYRC
jgi:hypothetical protein